MYVASEQQVQFVTLIEGFDMVTWRINYVISKRMHTKLAMSVLQGQFFLHYISSNDYGYMIAHFYAEYTLKREHTRFLIDQEFQVHSKEILKH